MGNILKILLFILLGLILLAIIIPLLWLVIKEASGLFGLSLGSLSENIGYIVFTVVCVIIIIWILANWN